MLNIKNLSKQKVWFDDLNFKLFDTLVTDSNNNEVLKSNDGFKKQVTVSIDNLANSTICGGGTDGIFLDIDVTVTAPRYKEPDDPDSDQPNPTYSYTVSYGEGGGSSSNPSSSTGVITIKLVGRDNFDPNTDYRLYTTPCQAWKYLISQSLGSGTEVGAYITNEGIIVMPNDLATLNSNGTRGFPFSAYVDSFGDTYIKTPSGNVKVTGMIHTHPYNANSKDIGSPSADDLALSATYPNVGQYIVSPFYINYFTAGYINGSQTATLINEATVYGAVSYSNLIDNCPGN